ncbi:hypothetical protein [Paucibacter sp. KCTC 42545]|uniref:hypothetical protein n=1 Tax=Paucibacter sp. KCTC 42545 TaxID=1768242 RepID=UPI0018D213AF|nr:hypothetical protein [Paucibacter sp. KCTC 42545]
MPNSADERRGIPTDAKQQASARAVASAPGAAEKSGYSLGMSIQARRPLLVFCLLLTALLAWLPQLDIVAKERVDAGLKRALISFATARTLNGVVSTLQETTLSFQPMGVGVTTAPGQVLDPINDLIEQFSSLMLGATVSFGLQKALLAIGAQPTVKACIAMALLAAALAVAWRGQMPRFARVVLTALLLIRFAVPVAALGSDAFFHAFLKDDYQASQQGLALSAGDMHGLVTDARQQASAAAPPSLADRFNQAIKLPDIGAFAEQIKQSAEQAINHLIQLIVVFLLQTLVVPLLLLWLMIAAVRAGLGSAATAGWAPPKQAAIR